MSVYIDRHTDAPECYDGFGTETIEVVGTSRRAGAEGNPVRLVRIDAEHDEWQTTRYSSGLYCYTSNTLTLADMERWGHWRLTGGAKTPDPSIIDTDRFDRNDLTDADYEALDDAGGPAR